MKRSYGPYTVEISNADKVLFPDGTTKGQLIDYHERISGAMLPHLRDRPLVRYRCPDGIDGESFYRKQIEDHAPDWIERVTVPKREGGEQTLVVADNQATLAWLASQAAVTLHPWSSRADRLERPDRLIIDLDPPEEKEFPVVRQAALWCRALLEELGLTPWVKTTGSRGLHVAVVLDREADFDAAREFARRAMELLARRYPDALTTEARRDKREGRVYLDVGRNAYAQTAVSPYSVRALPGCPVAAPLAWDELNRGDLEAGSWTMGNIFRRLGQRDDPWEAMSRNAGSIEPAMECLRKLES